MQIVKVVKDKNGLPSKVGIPANIAVRLEPATHMLVTFDGDSLIYRPAIIEARKEP